MAAGDRLTIYDLQEVKGDLWQARLKWRNLGTEIGVDDTTLESISMTERDPGDCLRKMLTGWLRGAQRSDQPNSKPRTWRTLIDALREESIDLSDLANKIEAAKYGTIQAAPLGATPTVAPQPVPYQGPVQYYHPPHYYQQQPGVFYGQPQGVAQQSVHPSRLPAQQPANHPIGQHPGGYMGYPPHAQPGGGVQPALTPQGVHQSPGQPAGAQASPQPIPGPARRFNDGHHAVLNQKLGSYASRWREIGGALGFKETELDNIQANVMLVTQGPPKSYLRRMLADWLQWAPNDGRGSPDFANTAMLFTALRIIDLGTLADDIYRSI